MKVLHVVLGIMFSILWIPAFVCVSLIYIAGTIIVLMPEIIALISVGLYAAYLYMIGLYYRCFGSKN